MSSNDKSEGGEQKTPAADAPKPVQHQSKPEAPAPAQSTPKAEKKSNGMMFVVGILLLGLALGIGYYFYHERNNPDNKLMHGETKDERAAE